MTTAPDPTPRLQQLRADWRQRLEAAAIPLPGPAWNDEIDRVWDASDFVAQQCLREPGLFQRLQTDGLLERPLATGEMTRQLDQALSGTVDEEGLSVALRRFRRDQMVRIIWRDISQRADLDETLADLSDLAECCIERSLSLLHGWAVARWGVPRDAAGREQRLVVLAMGKLGARELNLSSDIDLIFTFPAAGSTDGRKPLANEDFFTRVGRKLIKMLSDQTAEGFVFRVDMRLRPFGSAGPLALNFDAMEAYYQAHAREWERYAMIKARPVTGEPEDRAALEAMLQPFVFRRYLDYGAIESIREMKRMISAELHKKGMDANIKLGPGGIREIEFIGQAFQLVRGGREPALRIRPIQQVLQRLQAAGHLPDYAVSELIAAYRFLRLTENRIQAWRDQQTHLLPTDEEGQRRLANAMGYADWAVFEAELNQHRERVQGHFDRSFSAPQAESDSGQGVAAAWWELDADELAAILVTAGFADPEECARRLMAFRDSATCRRLSSRGHERLDQLMPLLLQAASRSESPDAALCRLLELLEAIANRTAYLDLLVENPLALSQLVQLSAQSPWVVQQLARQPILLDELLDPRRLFSPLARKELEAELDTLLERVEPGDLEQQMEALRQFAHGNILRVAAADLGEAIPLMVVSDYLTEIAEVVLQRVLALAWQHLVERHGRPGGLAEGATGFSIIGYGKLGGIELGYGSDLDLVFVYAAEGSASSDGKRPISNEQFYARLAQRVVHLLNTRTPSGQLYEVDTRLRPNGQSGLLVSSIKAFERYQREQAWIWEHQALLRARPVAGDEAVAARFAVIRREVLTQQRDAYALRREVREMREKMRASLDRSDENHFDLKQGVGGIADIEFMVQYSVLRWASEYPDLVEWTDNVRLLDGLERHRLLEGISGTQLADAYRRFRAAYHRSALQQRQGLVDQTEFREQRALVEGAWRVLMND